MDKREQAAVLRALHGLSYRLIGEQLGVAEMTVYGWLNPDYRRRENIKDKQRRARRSGAELRKRLVELERENQELRSKLEAWKRIAA